MTDAVLAAFATNQRINEYMIENLDDAVWDARTADGKGRTIRAIVAHIHAVRLMWLKAADKGRALPPELDKETCTREQAKTALAQSHAALAAVLRDGLASNRVKGFSPDAISFFAYLVSHDSHHRGQVSMLAKKLGHPLPKKVEFGMWEWGSRARETAGGAAGA